MKYIKPETILIEVELSNLVMGSPKKEHGILNPGTEKGKDNGDGNFVMSKHDSFEFDDSDSFNDSWD